MDEAALKKDILDYLTQIGAKHETVEHPPAPTVEEHTQYVGGMGGQAKQVMRLQNGRRFLRKHEALHTTHAPAFYSAALPQRQERQLRAALMLEGSGDRHEG